MSERRDYIETSRRSQPLEELMRKASKAKRRRGVTAEDADLALHKSWLASRKFAETATDPGGFCYLCHAFGIWDKGLNRYVAGPLHDPRCSLAPDDGPYPGWAASGRPRPQERVPIKEVPVPRAPSGIGTPLSELSGRPGHRGFERFCAIAASWGYD